MNNTANAPKNRKEKKESARVKRSPRASSASGRGARKSVILGALDRFSAWLYTLVLSSAIGSWLTESGRRGRPAEDGWLRRLFRSRKKRSDRYLFRFCRLIARMLEQSGICRLIAHLARGLLRCSINSYGIFLLFFGCYSVVSYYILANMHGGAPVSYLITGGILVLVSLPMFASTRSLAWGVRRSVLLRALVVRGLGIPDERLISYGEAGKERYLEALAVAIVGGSFTFLTPPHHLLAGTGCALLILLILQTPEVGMMLSVGLLPFFSVTKHPTLALLTLVGVTLLSYLVKLLRGKRMLRMDASDWLVLLLLVLFAFGGWATVGGRASLHSALIYVCFGAMYFVVANLVRSQEGVWRMLTALIAPCAIVSLLGIWQYVFSTPTLAYLDLNLFADLGGRVSSTWGNPNMLAEYLTLLLPLAFAAILLQRRLLRGFGSALCFAVVGVCLVLTWSRGAWLGSLIAMLIMLLMLDHRLLGWLLIGIVPVAAAIPFVPEQVVRRFLSIGTLSDSSIRYRLYLWEGVGRMLEDFWLTGVGVGESAFRAVYAGYALPGIETAMHSHSLYLQILCSLGIVGLVVFGAALLIWLRQMLGYARYGYLRGPRLVIIGCVAGIVALLVMGVFDEIWYNYRIYLLFWVLMGLGKAQMRVGNAESERALGPVDDERSQGELVLHFH